MEGYSNFLPIRHRQCRALLRSACEAEGAQSLMAHDSNAGAAWAAIEYPDADVRCITFGSPRVANRKFKKAFHGLVGTSLRLAYGGDPVPNFPSYR